MRFELLFIIMYILYQKQVDINRHEYKNSRAKLPLSTLFLYPFAHGFALELWGNSIKILKHKKSIKHNETPVYRGFQGFILS